MEKEEAKRFLGLLKKLSIVFDDNKQITTERLNIFAEIFEPYEIEQIERGVNHVLKNRVFKGFPLPAEIIQEMGDKKITRIKGATHEYHEFKSLNSHNTPEGEQSLKNHLALKYNILPGEIMDSSLNAPECSW